MSNISLDNVIRVTLLSALRGIAALNTSALALFTDEEPIPSDYGTYRVYLNANGVADDWGTSSGAYAYALAIFGQTPNLISGKGFLVIIPRNQSAAAQPAVLSGTTNINMLGLTATDYNINVDVDGVGASDVLIGTIDLTSVATAETSLNSTAVTAAGLEFSISGDLANARITLSTTADGATKSIELGSAATGTDITPLLQLPSSLEVTGSDAGVERVKDAILRTNGNVEYFGIILNEKLSDANLTETAALVQTLDKLLLVGSNLSADITGIFTTLLNSGYTHTRALYYGVSEVEALKFTAGYAGRALSVDFEGVRTAQTMHLKDIVGFVPDSTLNQTLIDSCARAGVDVYADFGVPKVFTSGANQYFDFIYMSLAFKINIQTAGFNYLARTNTRIPQTEEGMNGLKNAYRNVCEAFIDNGSFAPGAWNDSTTFGAPEDHIRNIADVGYYVYSTPIVEQSQASREARVAPVVQIAGKSAGAIHSSDVTVLIEA